MTAYAFHIVQTTCQTPGASNHATLVDAIVAAKKTGFSCQIYRTNAPWTRGTLAAQPGLVLRGFTTWDGSWQDSTPTGRVLPERECAG